MKTILMTALIALSAALYAGEGAAEVAEISQADLAKAVAAKQVVVIDVNGSESYSAGHIPGAIDFEARGAELAKVLPADKSTLIVAYCGGPQCTAWKDGAKSATELGYTNVKHFKGGISGWKAAGAATEAAQ